MNGPTFTIILCVSGEIQNGITYTRPRTCGARTTGKRPKRGAADLFELLNKYNPTDEIKLMSL